MEAYKSLIAAFEAIRDPRTLVWPLTESIWPTLIICSLYIFIVCRSRAWMANRPAFNIRYFLVAYNIVMVALSVWLVYEFIYIMYYGNYTVFGCMPVDTSMSDVALRTVRVGWWFYFTKIIELSDTMFFILRKKFHLITFLHVFHHVTMPPSVWIGFNIAPGGFGAYYTMLNSLVHVFMYTYYGLAAAGPAYQKYLWWKQHMTVFQIVQFFLLMIHSQQLFFIECNYPLPIACAIFIYAAIFTVLFSNYFYQAYIKQRRASAAAAKSVSNGNSHSKTTNGVAKSNGHHVHANGHSKDN